MPPKARHTAKIAKGARGAPGKKKSQWGEKTKFSLHCVCFYTQKSVLNSKKIVPASPNLPKQQAQLVLPGVLYWSIIEIFIAQFSETATFFVHLL